MSPAPAAGTGPDVPPVGPLAALRARTSILYKVVGVLVVTLVVSSVVTAFIASRLTSDALQAQADSIATSQLSLLKAEFDKRQRDLAASVRNLAETVNVGGLLDPARRGDLISALNRAAGGPLSLIRVLDPDGAELNPPVGIGMTLTAASIFSGESLVVEPGSRLLATTEGKFIQAVAVPIGPGRDPFVLVGGYLFDNRFAYDLRSRIGNLDNVLLVASGKVAGSSLPALTTTPPGQTEGEDDGGGSGLPDTPTVVRIEGKPWLVTYVSVGRSADDPVGGALGVALTNPISPLQRSLSNTRLLASVLLTLVALGL